MTISFLVLNEVMRKDYRKKVVECALRHRQNASISVRKELEEQLKRLTVPGFHKPLKAPIFKILPLVVEESHFSNELMGAVLQSWVENKSELKALIQNFLHSSGLPLVVLDQDNDSSVGFGGHWSTEELFQQVARFRGSHPEFDEDDTALMLCCLSGLAPLPARCEGTERPESGEETVRVKQDRLLPGNDQTVQTEPLLFEAWLRQLRELPATAAEWCEIDQFIDQLNNLVKEKEKEMERLHSRIRLKEALATLLEETQEHLKQLDMENVFTWTAVECDEQNTEGLVHQVDKFREMILEYLQLAQSPPVHPKERLLHNKELDQLVSILLDSYNQLNSSLVAVSSYDHEKPEEQAESLEQSSSEPLAEQNEDVPGETSIDIIIGLETPELSVPVIDQDVEASPEELATSGDNLSNPSTTPDSETETASEAIEENIDNLGAELESSVYEEKTVTPELEYKADSLSSEIDEVQDEHCSAATAPQEDTSATPPYKDEPNGVGIPEPPESITADRPVFTIDAECSLHELSERILKCDTGQRWTGLSYLVWQLMEKDKTGLAWHLSRRIEKSCPAEEMGLPSWLVRSVGLSPYVCQEAGQIAAILSSDFKSFNQDCFPPSMTQWNHAVRLLIASATLRPALLAPQTNASSILHALRMKEGLSSLYGLCDLIASFGDKQRALDPAALRGVRDRSSWNKDMDTLQNEISDWWKQAPSFTILFAAATKVWRYWLQKDGLIERLVRRLLQNEPSTVESVREDVLRLSDEREIIKEITYVDRHILERPSRSGITGRKAFGTLVRHVGEVVDFADRWVKAWGRYPGQSLEWTLSRAKELQENVAKLQKPVESELDCFADRFRSSLPVVCAAKICKRTLGNIRQLFDPDAEFSGKEPKLSHVLNVELLHFTSLPASNLPESQLSDETFMNELLMFLKENRWDWRRTFEMHSAAGNHENTKQIIQYLQVRPDLNLKADEFSSLRNQRLAECRTSIRNDLEETRKSIEGALAFGFLKEKERDEYNATIQQINSLLSELEVFQPYYQRLLEIRNAIYEKKQRALETTHQRLISSPIDVDGSEGQRILSVLNQGDVLTANEYIDMVLRGQAIPESSEPRDSFGEFFPEKVRLLDKHMEEYPPAAIIKQVKNRQDFCGINMNRPTGKQAEQGAEMLEAWFAMKKNQRIDEKNAFKVFSHLGFFPVKASVKDLARRTLVDLHTEVIRDRTRCPVAAFGSGTRGHYRVLFLWDRPPVDELINEMSFLPHGGALIVCHFGRMSEQRWRELGQQCKERRRNLVMIDDSLVLYLCGERGSRLPVLFSCTLPFTFIEPYVTTAGLVPPEMFYGRLRERESIIDPMGSCFIFGGRQLGKTALLRDAEAIVNEGKQAGQRALWIDLKVQGIGYDRSIEEIWTLLISELKRIEVLPVGISLHIGPERLFEHILDWLDEHSQRRILLLLDEADRFLDIDGKFEFINSSRLKGLMDRTNRRFKTVFAGLHNVQRSTNLENHPLAHYGEPICIGPLLENGEWRQARALVERPFASLGYKFESPDLVTRILSQTNYYPSLIQLYCQQLLGHVNNPYGSMQEVKDGPPFTITSQHVEDAYQSNDLRKAIRDRFIWTLQLDQRYQVIAYSIAYGSTTNMEMALSDGFSIDWIREEALSWWPKGFEKDPTFESFKILVEEMVGLGILRLVKEGHYGLRSPNVVALMGTQDEIEAELLFCSQWEAPPEYEAATFRNAYPHDQSKRSPLTAQQESDLRGRRNGVSLIFGSRMSGMDEVAPFLKLSCGEEFFIQVDNATDLNAFAEALKELEVRQKQGTTLVLVNHFMPWNESWIKSAFDRIRKLKSKTSFVRFIFLADPKTTWYLSERGNSCLQQLLDEGASFLSLKPWNDAALRQWLEDCSFGPRDQEGRQKITAATGNWPLLLREFWEKAKHDLHNWERHLEEMQKKQVQQDIAKILASSFGIVPGECWNVLQTLADYGEASKKELSELAESITPEAIDRVLHWADLLNYASKTGKGQWKINSTVGRLFEAKAQHKDNELTGRN